MTGYVHIPHRYSYAVLRHGYPLLHGPEISDEMWVEQSIRRATEKNALEHSKLGHRSIPLYMWVEDCPHVNPEQSEEFEALEEASDAEPKEPEDTYFERRRQAQENHPLWPAYEAAMSEYEDIHTGRICEASPMGYACEVCSEEDGEGGYEDTGCSRKERAREARDEFWWTYGGQDD